jgi:uncharacterized coiled-coil DUF342 family protein
VTAKQEIDALRKRAEAHEKEMDDLRGIVKGLAQTTQSHDRQIASIIRALDKQRGVVNALAASVIAHDGQIEALGDRIDQFLTGSARSKLRRTLVSAG